MSRGTTLRNVRIDDGLWDRAKVVAEQQDQSVSEIVRRVLEEYVSTVENESLAE